MTWRGLLVSVRDASEARAALAGGAAIIDVKEPANGPLGRAAVAAVAGVVGAVAGRAPWTVAAGELADRAAETASGRDAAWHAMVAAADGVKIGLAGMDGAADWEPRLRGFFAALPAPVGRIAVAYADWRRAGSPRPERVIDAAASLGCAAVLVDTFDKSAPGLLSGGCAAGEPAAWVRAARGAGLRVAVAGRLTLAEIPAAWDLGPDVVAVRSAVCSGGSFGRVDSELVGEAVRSGPGGAGSPNRVERVEAP
jgi:uncharacterized protein (UPF0264 family)